MQHEAETARRLRNWLGHRLCLHCLSKGAGASRAPVAFGSCPPHGQADSAYGSVNPYRLLGPAARASLGRQARPPSSPSYPEPIRPPRLRGSCRCDNAEADGEQLCLPRVLPSSPPAPPLPRIRSRPPVTRPAAPLPGPCPSATLSTPVPAASKFQLGVRCRGDSCTGLPPVGPGRKIARRQSRGSSRVATARSRPRPRAAAALAVSGGNRLCSVYAAEQQSSQAVAGACWAAPQGRAKWASVGEARQEFPELRAFSRCYPAPRARRAAPRRPQPSAGRRGLSRLVPLKSPSQAGGGTPRRHLQPSAGVQKRARQGTTRRVLASAGSRADARAGFSAMKAELCKHKSSILSRPPGRGRDGQGEAPAGFGGRPASPPAPVQSRLRQLLLRTAVRLTAQPGPARPRPALRWYLGLWCRRAGTASRARPAVRRRFETKFLDGIRPGFHSPL